MQITRRSFTAGIAASGALIGAGGVRAGEGLIRSHGASLIGELTYAADFPHFDYVNPNAPKGGTARQSTQGNFDSFNPFIVKGQPFRHRADLRYIDEIDPGSGLHHVWAAGGMDRISGGFLPCGL